jgi:hypothetical protein
MLIPLVAWAITGAIFFIKPGYGGAYDSLAVRTYALTDPIAVAPPPDWREVRYLTTVLGTHVLARTESGWTQFDPVTLQERPAPSSEALRLLVQDAFAANPDRYGQVASVEDRRFTTTTGVHVTLDWNRLALSQRGPDTDRIDGLYRVHYLQWTGIDWLDRVVGGVGLVLMLALSFAGARLLLLNRGSTQAPRT